MCSGAGGCPAHAILLATAPWVIAVHVLLHLSRRVCIGRALFQDCVHARNDLGNLLKHRGQLKEAKDCYLEAIRERPNLAVAWNNLGCVNLDEGNAQLAAQNFAEAVHCDPRLECIYSNLVSVVGVAGKVSVLSNLGQILRDENRLEESIIVYKEALQCSNSAALQAGLASVLHQTHNLREAAVHYQEAIRLQPTFVECHANLGHILRDLGDLQGARTSFLNAVQLDPLSANDFNNLACICKDLSVITEAIEYYTQSWKLAPDNAHVYCNLVHSLQMVCDWTDYDNRMQSLSKLVVDQENSGIFPSVHPHHTFLYPISNQSRRHIARAHADLAKRNCEVMALPPYTYDHLRVPCARLRVGYVSSDYKDHPTAHLMQSIPGYHNQSQRIELFCYCLCANDNSIYRQKLEREAEHFVDLSEMTDHRACADRIYADGIHILVNLNGYTKGARTEIFAWRPAPIQIMWLGYPGTSGSDYMDYHIGDDISTPMALWDSSFSEKRMCMPRTYFVGDHDAMLPLPPVADETKAAGTGSSSEAEVAGSFEEGGGGGGDAMSGVSSPASQPEQNANVGAHTTHGATWEAMVFLAPQQNQPLLAHQHQVQQMQQMQLSRTPVPHPQQLATLQLPQTQLGHAQLPHMPIAHAQLPHAAMVHAQLPHVQVAHAQLPHAQVAHAQLPHVHVAHAQLPHAQLPHAQLNHAQLNHAQLTHAVVQTAHQHIAPPLLAHVHPQLHVTQQANGGMAPNFGVTQWGSYNIPYVQTNYIMPGIDPYIHPTCSGVPLATSPAVLDCFAAMVYNLREN